MKKQKFLNPIMLAYKNVRHLIQTGDILCWKGVSKLSVLTRIFTRSPVTHVGIAIVEKSKNPWDFGRRVLSVEALGTSLDPNAQGVHAHRFSNRVELGRKSPLWILPLSKNFRKELDSNKLKKFLKSKLGTEFDFDQLINAGLDIGEPKFKLFMNVENLDKLFCSEIVAAALREAYKGKWELNASEVTPADVAEWKAPITRYGVTQRRFPDIILLIYKNLTLQNKFSP